MAEKTLKSIKFHGLEDTYKIPSTAEDVGAASMSYTKKVGNPHNLLDNSDFSNPVNQRGQTAYTLGNSAYAYAIDRWKGRSGTLTLNDGYVNWKTTKDAQYKRIRQVTPHTLEVGHSYTLAMLARVNEASKAYLRFATNGGAAVKELELSSNSDFEWIILNVTMTTSSYEQFMIEILASNSADRYIDIDIKAMCLYEGIYTAETLPEYQPKGYGAEFAECRRYYKPMVEANIFESASGIYSVGYTHDMRITPTITIDEVTLYGVASITDFSGAVFNVNIHTFRFVSLPSLLSAGWDKATLIFTLNAEL